MTTPLPQIMLLAPFTIFLPLNPKTQTPLPFLQVAYLLNSNFDSLQLSPVMAKLTGNGVQSANIYTGCLELNNVGVFWNQTTPIGSLPLNLTVAYVPNPQVRSK